MRATMLHRFLQPTPLLRLRLTTRASQLRCLSSNTAATSVSEPLRILFCGSDIFSCDSLKALHQEHAQNKQLIESLEVMVLPAKRAGRGLKEVKEVPCKELAQELGLRYHQRQTFKDWNLPNRTNLIVVVSFGLFVPPRIINSAKFGGLNVHPSLLPHLRGPAPVHHAILRGDTHTGITLQTLDPEKFDHGVILSQTPEPGLPVPPSMILPKLTKALSVAAAEMLVQGLRDGLHIPPYKDVGWMANRLGPDATLVHAPKVTKADAQIDWQTWQVSDFERRGNVFPEMWTQARNSRGQLKRIILIKWHRALMREVSGRTEIISFYYREGEGNLRETKVEMRVNDSSHICFIQTMHGGWVKGKRAKVDGAMEKFSPAAFKEFLKANKG